MANDKMITLSMYARSQNNYDTIGGMRNFYWRKSLTATNYLNQPEVRFALHIPSTISKWVACNPSANLINEQRYNDTTILFQQVLNSNYPLNILIYDGDASTSYQFIGDEWFIEKIAKMYSMVTVQERIPWIYHSQIAGYQKLFKMSTKIDVSENKSKLQFVTIKGAGHFISSDRPGQLLQMLNNFLEQNNLSTPIPISIKFKPLKKQYEILDQIATGADSSCSDKNLFVEEKSEANKFDDNINMPGRTFWYNLETVTGHLDDGQGNSLNFEQIILKEEEMSGRLFNEF
uniref:Uncharacterized protein n=1 Tax=Wuchereria bancrofti TaxID=6293 RepID=A0A1I8F1M0_WUCBA